MFERKKLQIVGAAATVLMAGSAALAQDAGDLGGMVTPAVNNGPGVGAGIMGGGAFGKAMGGAMNLAAPHVAPSAPVTGATMYFPQAGHLSSLSPHAGKAHATRKPSFVMETLSSSAKSPAHGAPNLVPSSAATEFHSSSKSIDASDIIFDGSRRVK